VTAILPQAYVAFSLAPTRLTPGRIRLRIPAQRGRKTYFVETSQRVKDLSQVLDVTVNPLTASMLILHDSSLEVLLPRIEALAELKIVAREKLPLDEIALPKLTEKEKAVLEFLLFASLSAYQFWNGQVLSAGSALATNAQEFWSRIPHEGKT
jgi:hypothetical protein